MAIRDKIKKLMVIVVCYVLTELLEALYGVVCDYLSGTDVTTSLQNRFREMLKRVAEKVVNDVKEYVVSQIIAFLESVSE